MINKNVTYYLGAGASYNSQPLLNTMKERMRILLEMLEGSIDKKYNKMLNVEGTTSLFLKYKDIVEEATQHHTPDTYAKKLHLTNQQDKLDKLKEFLQLYFLFEQDETQDAYHYHPLDEERNRSTVIEFDTEGKRPNEYTSRNQLIFSEQEIKLWHNIATTMDERYDPFFATLLEEKEGKVLKLPEHLNIISWNYDNQFEIAYEKYLSDNNFKEFKSSDNLKIIPCAYKKYDISNKRLIKLNGHCTRAILDPRSDELHKTYNFKKALELLVEDKKIPIKIKYAWEEFDDKLYKSNPEETLHTKMMNQAKKVIRETKELVIIGYSFPYFNREIDNQILKEGDFNKIYIQEINMDRFNAVKENLLSIIGDHNESKVIPKLDTSQFFIPM